MAARKKPSNIFKAGEVTYLSTPGSVIWSFACTSESSCWREVDQLERSVNHQAWEENLKELVMFKLILKKMEGGTWALAAVWKRTIYLPSPFWVKEEATELYFCMKSKCNEALDLIPWGRGTLTVLQSRPANMNDTGHSWSCSGAIKFGTTKKNSTFTLFTFQLFILEEKHRKVFNGQDGQKQLFLSLPFLPPSHSFSFP